MASTNRRAFIKDSLATSALLAFPFLARADKEPKIGDVGEAVAAALRHMKEENKPGLVIVVPPEVEKAQLRLKALSEWLGGGEVPLLEDADGKRLQGQEADAGSQVRQLLCQAVLVCVSRPEAQDRWGLKETAEYAVLGPEGKLLAESPAIDKPLFMTEALTELVHGPRGEHRAAFARRQKAALGEETALRVTAALRNLDAADFATRQEASEQLVPLAAKVPAVLAEVLAGKPHLELRQRVAALLDEVYTAAPSNRPGVRQPFGTFWEKQVCVAKCGMACPSPSARVFLRILTNVKP